MTHHVNVPIIHPRADVTVRVDPETLTWWHEAGLSMQWEYHNDGPTFRGPEGSTQKVADFILGVPAEFIDGSAFNLTRANLRPAEVNSRWDV